MVLLRARGPVRQLAATSRATVVQRIGAFRAIRAFEAADERTRGLGGEGGAAAFAVGAHLERHQAAASVTASQIAATTASTSPASSPSAMTRITGSVPDGRMTRRPLPASCASAPAMIVLTLTSS